MSDLFKFHVITSFEVKCYLYDVRNALEFGEPRIEYKIVSLERPMGTKFVDKFFA